MRSYDPQTGRWLQVDPYDEFTSPYVGMGNDPVNNVDPDGGAAWFRPKPPGSYVRNFDKLTEIGKSFLEGFAEVVVSTMKGTVNTVLHPVETAKGIVHAVTNPKETWNSIKESAQDAWNTLKSGDPVKIAHMAGTLAGKLVTGGVEGKIMSTLGKVTKVTKIIAKAKTVLKEAAMVPVAPIAGVVNKVLSKGWIKKSLYKELEDEFGVEMRNTFENALKKGGAIREKAAEGIKELKGNGIEGYRYELKVTGKYGNYRLLGNTKTWTNSKGVSQSMIIFEKLYRK